VSEALRAVVAACVRHGVTIILSALALTASATLVTLRNRRVEASELHVLPAAEAYVARYREHSTTFGELDELVIVVRSRSVQQAQTFATRLVAALRAGPIAFNHLAYRVALDDFDGAALLYLPRPALERSEGVGLRSPRARQATPDFFPPW
jgi:hypothetical protein